MAFVTALRRMAHVRLREYPWRTAAVTAAVTSAARLTAQRGFTGGSRCANEAQLEPIPVTPVGPGEMPGQRREKVTDARMPDVVPGTPNGAFKALAPTEEELGFCRPCHAVTTHNHEISHSI
ncbi:hypothetical protein EYF80_034117 [Liparis tanakae]|uniref:Uncharacterized protein n=1 Tax=Liparis tanakae TaxID=230148 RepID=A0A4Z2GSI3_9TELE|nr:hypothetical protein EYF80_034117 [Liparis tanakae]